MLNIEKVSLVHFPKSTTILECANGAFTVSENGIIKFNYNRKPNLEKVREVSAQLEQAEAELQLALKSEADRFELATIRANIRRLESLLALVQATNVPAQYECRGIDTNEILDKRLELAKNAKQNSVWSVAYATGLRFEDLEHPSEDIEFDEGDVIVTHREWHYIGKKSNRGAE